MAGQSTTGGQAEMGTRGETASLSSDPSRPLGPWGRRIYREPLGRKIHREPNTIEMLAPFTCPPVVACDQLAGAPSRRMARTDASTDSIEVPVAFSTRCSKASSEPLLFGASRSSTCRSPFTS